VGIGYNGFPNGCGDDELPWARESETNSPLDTKYPVSLVDCLLVGLVTDLLTSSRAQYVCHAEMNAILNKNSTDVKGCTVRWRVCVHAVSVHACRSDGDLLVQIYVALFPCNECAKLIIQSGISRVVYCSDKYNHECVLLAVKEATSLISLTVLVDLVRLQLEVCGLAPAHGHGGRQVLAAQVAALQGRHRLLFGAVEAARPLDRHQSGQKDTRTPTS